jgi:hypothetical protein
LFSSFDTKRKNNDKLTMKRRDAEIVQRDEEERSGDGDEGERSSE